MAQPGQALYDPPAHRGAPRLSPGRDTDWRLVAGHTGRLPGCAIAQDIDSDGSASPPPRIRLLCGPSSVIAGHASAWPAGTTVEARRSPIQLPAMSIFPGAAAYTLGTVPEVTHTHTDCPRSCRGRCARRDLRHGVGGRRRGAGTARPQPAVSCRTSRAAATSDRPGARRDRPHPGHLGAHGPAPDQRDLPATERGQPVPGRHGGGPSGLAVISSAPGPQRDLHCHRLKDHQPARVPARQLVSPLRPAASGDREPDSKACVVLKCPLVGPPHRD
jgi:hypothetical protein